MIVLIEGLGSISRKHISALRNSQPNVKLYALRSKAASPSEEGIINIYDYNQLTEKPDFIIISNITQRHRVSVENAIKLGVPIMIEKPVLPSLTAADFDLNERIKSLGIKTYVACNLRFLNVLQFLKKHLDESTVGINEVNVYCGSYFPDWRPKRDYKTMYSAQKGEGGGIHLELIHEMDYTSWLFGIPTILNFTTSSRSTIDIEAADYAHYLLDYPKFIATITLNFYRKEIKRTIEVIFEDRTWIVDLVKGNIHDGLGKLIYQSGQQVIETYDVQMRHMIDVVKGKSESHNTFEDSLEVLKLSLGNA
jgi:predicted dehydrogenase